MFLKILNLTKIIGASVEIYLSYGGARWPCGQYARRMIAEAKQRWLVIQKLIITSFRKQVKPLVPAAFATTHR
jgi:hypothetical protein